MPFQSDAQRRAMYAAAEGPSTLGIPRAAAEKFIRHARKHKKGSALQRAKRKMQGR